MFLSTVALHDQFKAKRNVSPVKVETLAAGQSAVAMCDGVFVPEGGTDRLLFQSEWKLYGHRGQRGQASKRLTDRGFGTCIEGVIHLQYI